MPELKWALDILSAFVVMILSAFGPANISNGDLRTVQQELANLSAAGLITSWSNGYHRFYRANREHELFTHLLQIVQVSGRLPRVKKEPSRRKG